MLADRYVVARFMRLITSMVEQTKMTTARAMTWFVLISAFWERIYAASAPTGIRKAGLNPTGSRIPDRTDIQGGSSEVTVSAPDIEFMLDPAYRRKVLRSAVSSLGMPFDSLPE